MVTRAHVMPYLGQHVVVQTREGAIHHGILHSVSDDGIYLRSMAGRVRMANGDGSLAIDLDEKDKSLQDDVEQVWFPFLFFPWWGLGGFWPWGLWW